jgi:hypothetical protein
MPEIGWIDALRRWNLGGTSWCVPKKGTVGYNTVMKIRRGEPATVAEHVKEIERKKVKTSMAISLDNPEADKMDVAATKPARRTVKAKVPASPDMEDKPTPPHEPKMDVKFKDIFLTFLKNVDAGESAEHENRVLRNSDDGEKYHMWRSTKSYPIFSPFTIHPTHEVNVGPIRLELGWENPTLPPTWLEDNRVDPLTQISVLAVGFDKKIGRMSAKDALKEAIRVLEEASVEPPKPYSRNLGDGKVETEPQALWGKNYTKANIDAYFTKKIHAQFPAIYAPKESTRRNALEEDLDTVPKLVAYLKHKKVKGVSDKMTKKTLVDKLPLPTPDDENYLATLEDTGRPNADPFTRNIVKDALERLNRLGKGMA